MKLQFSNKMSQDKENAYENEMYHRDSESLFSRKWGMESACLALRMHKWKNIICLNDWKLACVSNDLMEVNAKLQNTPSYRPAENAYQVLEDLLSKCDSPCKSEFIGL